MFAFFGRSMSFNLISVVFSGFCYRFFFREQCSSIVVNEETLFITISQFFISFHWRLLMFLFSLRAATEKPTMLCIFYASLLCVQAFLLFITYPIWRDQKKRKTTTSAAQRIHGTPTMTTDYGYDISRGIPTKKSNLVWFRHVPHISVANTETPGSFQIMCVCVCVIQLNRTR